MSAESLSARNTLDRPKAIRERRRQVKAKGGTEVRLAALSACVLCLER